jgi:uncharacterized membrane-anchored protein YjiN (DUF445 family)
MTTFKKAIERNLKKVITKLKTEEKKVEKNNDRINHLKKEKTNLSVSEKLLKNIREDYSHNKIDINSALLYTIGENIFKNKIEVNQFQDSDLEIFTKIIRNLSTDRSKVLLKSIINWLKKLDDKTLLRVINSHSLYEDLFELDDI